MADKDLKKGKAYCLRLLASRARSEWEITSRLEEKGYEGQICRDILDSLTEEGLIDDLDFTRQWIDSRLRSSPRGKNILRAELERKGVKNKIIEQVFLENPVCLDDREIAVKIINEKLERCGNDDPLKLKGKLYRLLTQKGIDTEIAEDIINDIMGS